VRDVEDANELGNEGAGVPAIERHRKRARNAKIREKRLTRKKYTLTHTHTNARTHTQIHTQNKTKRAKVEGELKQLHCNELWLAVGLRGLLTVYQLPNTDA
jgi:hypothetical protein